MITGHVTSARRAIIRITVRGAGAREETIDAIIDTGFDGFYTSSYAKAQKVVNARRNPRVAVMIEAGERYAEFRGVMIRGRCEVIALLPGPALAQRRGSAFRSSRAKCRPASSCPTFSGNRSSPRLGSNRFSGASASYRFM